MMIPRQVCSNRFHQIAIAAAALLTANISYVNALTDAEQIAKCIDDIRSGPAIYYTPEAAAYFSARGNYPVSGISSNKDAAMRSFHATTKLGGYPQAMVKDAIPVIMDYFPKAIHVVEIRQASFAREGTFDDCVSTYVMSAKNQLVLSSPFLEYASLSLCESFIEGSYETEMLSKQVNAAGAIVEALFNLRITFTFYAGECALSRITGMNLGHDPSAWRQWWQGSSFGAYTTVPSSATGSSFGAYTTPSSSTGSSFGAYTGTAPSSGSSSPTLNTTPSSPYAYSYTYTVPGQTPTPATPATTQAAAPRSSYPDIVIGGKYRVALSTGDDFTGTVESRDDTSMVLETVQGKPYAFKFSLMQNYQVIELPKPKMVSQAPTLSGAEMTGFSDLQQRVINNQIVQVTVSNGSVFKGRLLSIADEGLKMDVDGSPISIARTMIVQIIVLPPQSAASSGVASQMQSSPSAAAPQGPFDTLWTRNPASEKGRPKPDILYYGTILDEGDNYVTLKSAERGEPIKFSRDDITRFIRHSSENANDALARYAKPLVCPPDMVVVDMPPGRGNKPFFRVCIDKYEYPNRPGVVPRTNVAFDDARSLCSQMGKRLCTAEEWMGACSGLDGRSYPYGNSFEQELCNADTRMVETSGNRVRCISPAGAYDMVGNVFEWVVTQHGKLALMGGPYSKCQTVSPAQNGDAKPQSGLRCCRSN